MDIQLITLVLNGISALSSGVQLYRQCIENNNVDQFEDLVEHQSIRQATENDAHLFGGVISDDILEGVLNNIEDRQKRLIDSVRDRERSKARRLRDADEISSDICFELNYIKRFNQGKLPYIETPDLYELWLEHDCK